jgi:hypothetical protein
MLEWQMGHVGWQLPILTALLFTGWVVPDSTQPVYSSSEARGWLVTIAAGMGKDYSIESPGGILCGH